MRISHLSASTSYSAAAVGGSHKEDGEPAVFILGLVLCLPRVNCGRGDQW